MPTRQTTFSRTSAASSGPLSGDYLWSNAANWSLGAPPADGDSVSTAVAGFDDLASLSLASLTLGSSGVVEVTGASLDVTTLAGTSGAVLAANADFLGTPVTVTVGTITGSGGLYGASNPGAIFLDQSAVDAGEVYAAQDGGLTELSAAPISASTLQYVGADSTFALQNPAAVNAVALRSVAPDDVLELPGSSVSSVSFGAGSLSVTTNDGSYSFSNVTYQNGPLTGYSAAPDASTGLEAITFHGLDTFSQTSAASSGPLIGDYLWSNAANWSLGAPPADGDSASTGVTGFDDLASLSLASLSLGSSGVVEVTGASLDVTTLAGTSGAVLAANADFLGTPVTVTVGTITGSGGLYGASNPGAIVLDQSAVDAGEVYAAQDGGLTELSAAPISASTLQYVGAGSTFALQNPAAVNAVALRSVAPDDVLELPGSSVSSVSFGAGSLSITTNDGSYSFSNVTYQNGPLTGYSAAPDTSTGLEAITFHGLDTFSQTSAASSGPLIGDYLWSNAANWSLGAPPADGDDASTGVTGFDDLASLSLASLTLGSSGVVEVTGASLDVTTLAGTSGAVLAANADFLGTPVTVTVGTITGSGGLYGASNPSAIFLDQSAVDAGEVYAAQDGGLTELSATPISASTLQYVGAGSTFALQNPAAANAVALKDVAPDDVLELPGSSVSSVSFGAGSLSITTNDGSYSFSNVTYQNGPLTGYSAAPDTSTGLEAVTLLCFCEGSLIRTPSGDVPVETLEVGTSVVTWRGEHRPITWIGTGKVLATRGRRNAATPVIVRKNALGDNVPHADPRVTKGHSLFIDGVLVPVEFLINHRSILWDDRAQEVSIYHVELATHDVLIANGAPAESYRDDGNRWLFRNANSAWGLKMQEPCAMLLTGGAVVDGIWARLLARSGTRPGLLLVDDPDLHLRVDGHRVDPVRISDTGYVFRGLSGGPFRDVRIISRAAAPDELGLARDPRVLGVAVRNVTMLAGPRHRTIEARDDRLRDGFHRYEPELDIRWTDGDARLPAELFAGFNAPVDLLLQVNGVTRYLATEEAGSRAA